MREKRRSEAEIEAHQQQEAALKKSEAVRGELETQLSRLESQVESEQDETSSLIEARFDQVRHQGEVYRLELRSANSEIRALGTEIEDGHAREAILSRERDGLISELRSFKMKDQDWEDVLDKKKEKISSLGSQLESQTSASKRFSEEQKKHIFSLETALNMSEDKLLKTMEESDAARLTAVIRGEELAERDRALESEYGLTASLRFKSAVLDSMRQRGLRELERLSNPNPNPNPNWRSQRA